MGILFRELLKKSLSLALWFLLILMGFPKMLIWTTVREMTEVMNAFGMSINEHLGCLKLSGIVEAKSEKSSEQIENMIGGGYAMMKMSLPNDQNIDSMIRGFSIKRNDSTLLIDLEISVDAIIDRLKKEAEKSI